MIIWDTGPEMFWADLKLWTKPDDRESKTVNHSRWFLKLDQSGPLQNQKAETSQEHSGICISFVNSKFSIIFQTGNTKTW